MLRSWLCLSTIGLSLGCAGNEPNVDVVGIQDVTEQLDAQRVAIRGCLVLLDRSDIYAITTNCETDPGAANPLVLIQSPGLSIEDINANDRKLSQHVGNRCVIEGDLYLSSRSRTGYQLVDAKLRGCEPWTLAASASCESKSGRCPAMTSIDDTPVVILDSTFDLSDLTMRVTEIGGTQVSLYLDNDSYRVGRIVVVDNQSFLELEDENGKVAMAYLTDDHSHQEFSNGLRAAIDLCDPESKRIVEQFVRANVFGYGAKTVRMSSVRPDGVKLDRDYADGSTYYELRIPIGEFQGVRTWVVIRQIPDDLGGEIDPSTANPD